MRATVWVRASGAQPSGHRFGYEEVADHASRLAATRLALAYRFGNPVSASEIRLMRAPGDEPDELTPEQKLAELRATGMDLEACLRVWLAGVKNVTPAADPAKNAPENAQNEPTAPLADAFLDV
jgi:hypothetical protein